jgi:Flp pilus assembly protein TadB
VLQGVLTHPSGKMRSKGNDRPSKGVSLIAFVFLVIVLFFLVGILLSYPALLAEAILVFAFSGFMIYHFGNRTPRRRR